MCHINVKQTAKPGEWEKFVPLKWVQKLRNCFSDRPRLYGGHVCLYRMFRAQADWILTHTSQDTEQITIEASVTLDGVTLTDPLIRWSSNECREIPVSADKMFWTSNKSAQWTLYMFRKNLLQRLNGKRFVVLMVESIRWCRLIRYLFTNASENLLPPSSSRWQWRLLWRPLLWWAFIHISGEPVDSVFRTEEEQALTWATMKV
jgi:hypothetical protein